MRVICNIINALIIILVFTCFRCGGRAASVSTRASAEEIPEDELRLSKQHLKENENVLQQPGPTALPIVDAALDIVKEDGTALNRTKKFALSSRLPPGSVCVQFNPVHPEDSPFVVCEPIAALDPSTRRLGLPARSPYFPPQQQPQQQSPVVVLPTDVLHKLTASKQISLPLAYYEEPRPYSFGSSPTIPSYADPYFAGMLPSQYGSYTPSEYHSPILADYTEEAGISSAPLDAPESPAKMKETRPQRLQQGKYSPIKTVSASKPTSSSQRFAQGINENAKSGSGEVSVDSRKVQHKQVTKAPYPYKISPIPFAVYNELFQSPEEDVSNQYHSENLLLSPASQPYHPSHGLLQPPYRMTCKLDVNSEGAHLAQADKYLRPLALLKLMAKTDRKYEDTLHHLPTSFLNEAAEMKSSSGSGTGSSEIRESKQEGKTVTEKLENKQTVPKERRIDQEDVAQNKTTYKMSEMEAYNYQEKIRKLMEIQHRLQHLQQISSDSPAEVAESLYLVAQELQILADQQKKLVQEINAHGDRIPSYYKGSVGADTFESLPTGSEEKTTLEILLENEPSKDIHSTQFITHMESGTNIDTEQLYVIKEPNYKASEARPEKDADQEKQKQRKMVVKDKLLQQYRMETEGTPIQMKAKQKHQNITTSGSSQNARQAADLEDISESASGKLDPGKMQGKQSNNDKPISSEKKVSETDNAQPKSEKDGNESLSTSPTAETPSFEREANNKPSNQTIKQAQPNPENQREKDSNDESSKLSPLSAQRSIVNETVKEAQSESSNIPRKHDADEEKSAQDTSLSSPPSVVRSVTDGKSNKTMKEAQPDTGSETQKHNIKEKSAQESLSSSLAPVLLTLSDERSITNETMTDTESPSSTSGRKSDADEGKSTKDLSSPTPLTERNVANETMDNVQSPNGAISRVNDTREEKSAQHLSSPIPTQTVLSSERSVTDAILPSTQSSDKNKSRESDSSKENSTQVSSSPQPSAERSALSEIVRNIISPDTNKPAEIYSSEDSSAQGSLPLSSAERNVWIRNVTDVLPDYSSKPKESDSSEEKSAQGSAPSSSPAPGATSAGRSATKQTLKEAQPTTAIELRGHNASKEKSAQDSLHTSPFPVSSEKSATQDKINKKVKEIQQIVSSTGTEVDTAKAKAAEVSLEINVNQPVQRTADQGSSESPPDQPVDFVNTTQKGKEGHSTKPKMVNSSQQRTTESLETASHLKQSPSIEDVQSANSSVKEKASAAYSDSRMSEGIDEPKSSQSGQKQSVVSSIENTPIQGKNMEDLASQISKRDPLSSKGQILSNFASYKHSPSYGSAVSDYSMLPAKYIPVSIQSYEQPDFLFQNPHTKDRIFPIPVQDERWKNFLGSWYTSVSPNVYFPSSALPAVNSNILYVPQSYPNTPLTPASYSTDYTFRDASKPVLSRMNAPELSNNDSPDGVPQSLQGKPLVMLILEQ